MEEETGREYHPSSCVALLEESEKQKSEQKQEFEKWKPEEMTDLSVARILPFELGIRYTGEVVYNPSAIFEVEGENYLCGRVEHRKKNRSRVILFKEGKDGIWRPAEGLPVLPLEDGFVVQNEKEIIVGGVEICHKPTIEHPDKIDYCTIFYHGCRLETLKEFARGPDRMKDIRFVYLENGKIGVFTRPQGIQSDGSDCGRGMIAYIELDSRHDLNPENLSKARIIENQFAAGEWGGANQVYLLPDGRIGVVGHIAYIDAEHNRHYYAMTFIYDPVTHQATPIKIIARRSDFPASGAKSPDLRDVVFPGGMVRHGDGTATLYVGLSDETSGCIRIVDPFW
jgi:hypothetical protein